MPEVSQLSEAEDEAAGLVACEATACEGAPIPKNSKTITQVCRFRLVSNELKCTSMKRFTCHCT